MGEAGGGGFINKYINIIYTFLRYIDRVGERYIPFSFSFLFFVFLFSFFSLSLSLVPTPLRK